jgi:hypothetical protein
MAVKKEEKKKLDIFELRKELMAVAEKEARRKPDISKQDLKKKLGEHVTKLKIVDSTLSPELKSVVEKLIGICAEVAVKTLEVYLRAKKEFEKDGPKAKAGKAPAKKPVAKKKK